VPLDPHPEELPQGGAPIVLLRAALRRGHGVERLGIEQIGPAIVDLRETGVLRQPGQGAVLRALERFEERVDPISESNSALPW
jgi:hypothetical protein